MKNLSYNFESFTQIYQKSKIKNIWIYGKKFSDHSLMDFLPDFDIAHFSFIFRVKYLVQVVVLQWDHFPQFL